MVGFGCRQGTSLELQVKGIRKFMGESMMQLITVCLVRGTASFIALLRRKEELVQSNAYQREQNDELSKRLAALSDLPEGAFSHTTAQPILDRCFSFNRKQSHHLLSKL